MILQRSHSRWVFIYIDSPSPSPLPCIVIADHCWLAAVHIIRGKSGEGWWKQKEAKQFPKSELVSPCSCNSDDSALLWMLCKSRGTADGCQSTMTPSNREETYNKDSFNIPRQEVMVIR